MIFYCVASGPSLTQHQVDIISNAKRLDSSVMVCCVNNTYELFDEGIVDMIFAADRHWWRDHFNTVKSKHPNAVRYTLETHNPYPTVINSIAWRDSTDQARKYNVVYHGNNSGQMAINLIHILYRCTTIMVGFDFKHSDDGKKHYFGDHPPKYRANANTTGWIEGFVNMLEIYPEMNNLLYNATPNSAISEQIVPRISLTD